MPNQERSLFERRPLNEITEIPEDIISVYVAERHIWAEGGSPEARKNRQVETRTIQEFLIDPVRPFLNDIFRQLAAPYSGDRKSDPIGQGYWIQAEFGSGKSHLLSFIGSLALGSDKEWAIIQEKESLAGKGRRESLYTFYENGLAKKATESKGILVAVKTLVGYGSGGLGVNDTGKTLANYILDAVAEQFYLETGKTLPLYPTQQLAERFLLTDDFERYRRDLEKFLKDPNFFDEEEQEDIGSFLDDLQNNLDPAVQRDCGDRLWDFYKRYLRIQPSDINIDTEPLLEHMMTRLLDAGYAGLLLILDEVSLYMKDRNDSQRVEDEKTLVVLSNRLAKVKNLPVWTVCAAQQAIETKMAGVKNIIADERLKEIPLLNKQAYYYDIALSRVRRVTDDKAVDRYYEDYRRSFSWPEASGKDQFVHFFPFYPPSIDVVRTLSYNLTTVRSALYFMLQTLKTQRKRGSRELISLWALFDDVVEFEEDPSGTTRGITSVKSKWPDEWHAYEAAKHQLDTVTKGKLKAYRPRCEKIIKTLFLYHIAGMAPNGLSPEELMNSVMEWRDQDQQKADLQDNIGHYEILAGELALELAQVVKVGHNFQFNPTGTATDPRDHFEKARAEAVQNEVLRRQAWEALLALSQENWQVITQLMKLDLTFGVRSVFREFAPASQMDIAIKWHGRMITGRVLMRDLRSEALRGGLLTSINSAETGLDFTVYVSSYPVAQHLDNLIQSKNDGRMLFWSPDDLSSTERELLIDFAAYRTLVQDFRTRDSQEAREVLDWVQSRLRDQMGTIYRIVPDSYNRGRIAALDHSNVAFNLQGELKAILEPIVGQVLDTVYVSRELDFSFQVPFDDTAAVKVINGIVKLGEIPRGAKPTQEISASQNYAVDLQIVKHNNAMKIQLDGCRYTTDMLDWIEEKVRGSNGSMPVKTIYKNFMGTGGPNGVNYGLSRRMVQLYLLCLVTDGKIRISLDGRNMPADKIDYTNIAGIDFKAAVLDAFDEIQRLKAPEGWELLAPFAAKLLKDEALTTYKQEADIQTGVMRTVEYKEQQQRDFLRLHSDAVTLFSDIGRDNPYSDTLLAWEKFFTTDIKTDEPITYLRHGLDEAFDYHIYREDRIDPNELADFAQRIDMLEQVKLLTQYRDDIRAASEYSRYKMPQIKELAPVQRILEKAVVRLDQLEKLATNETSLSSELLEPVAKAIETYATYFLNSFDEVMRCLDETRAAIQQMDISPAYTALSQLANITQLGTDPRSAIIQFIDGKLMELAEAFPETLTRAVLERDLRSEPESPRCKMNLHNANESINWINTVRTECEVAIEAALREKAALLTSDALRGRLAQGKGERFIAGLLATQEVDEAAAYLAEKINEPAAPNPVELLERFLKTLRVTRVALKDFHPTKTTIERADVDAVVAEFRSFLIQALSGGDDELPIIELE